ncbi:SulP family inorganic anion transporter [Alkaliflexus imshenetskii]|uniref:SulP family inorganic anion transporter n=1 Tax=Alkaliflexus imshenetskii TaxID=286730 RepID=UPI00047CBFD0|nr:SulP family inorganic anion transporter [Alkaliflexus imshenetskii]
MKEILSFFDYRQQINYRTEILSGLTVALALVPEAVAFSLIAGLSPLTGLYAAFTIGLITSIFGGRPGMISGATGAIAMVIVSLVKTIHLRHLSQDCHKLLQNADKIIEVNIMEDPTYKVVVNKKAVN